jgi:predicted nucleic acid-binding protein
VTVVVDASVAIKWFLPEPHGDAAQALETGRFARHLLWITEVPHA